MGMPNVIELAHGGGGREMWSFIENFIVSKVPSSFRKAMNGIGLEELDDGAAIKIGNNYVVISLDSFTVKPLFFPGGNLGSLAAAGSINDLVMMGAKPIAAMDALVVEAGTPIDVVEKILMSFINTLTSEGVAVIGGDFKVMPHGQVDVAVMSIAGIGITKRLIVDSELKPGDKIIVTNTIAEHGTTIIAAQLGYADRIKVQSDSKPLAKLLLPIYEKFGSFIRAARDPTRGGVAAVLTEWASITGTTIVINRAEIPIKQEVKHFLDMLGIDPLNVACEGIALLGVDPNIASDIVKELHSRGARNATIIGEVRTPKNPVLRGKVVAITEIGGATIIEPQAAPVPRIC